MMAKTTETVATDWTHPLNVDIILSYKMINLYIYLL